MSLFIVMIIIGIVMVGVSTVENENFKTAAEITNWGLSFQEDGKPPIANADAELLSTYDSFFMGDPNSNTIYLTFDAGYENGYTSEILDILNNHQISATFFLVGNYLETEQELVKRMVNEGHIIGNHTWSHPDMSTINSLEAFNDELYKFDSKLLEITGQETLKIYRPPQGKFDINNLQMAKDLGYHTVFWSLAYVDWYEDSQPSHDEAFDKLLSRIHGGAVVLLHSTSSTNSEILDELLTKWKQMGYSFGDIRELCI